MSIDVNALVRACHKFVDEMEKSGFSGYDRWGIAQALGRKPNVPDFDFNEVVEDPFSKIEKHPSTGQRTSQIREK